MYSDSVEKLIELFSQFPTIGKRTASRFVFYLTKQNKETINNLITAIKELEEKTKTCSLCNKIFEGEQKLCEICSNKGREKETLCVIEKEVDLETIEKTKTYKGLYYIYNDLDSIIERIKKDSLKEIILAFNPTTEGIKTTLFLKRKLEPYNIKVSQLGLGLPVGAELEYADDETLNSSFLNRK